MAEDTDLERALGEIGSTGLKEFGGRVSEEWHRELRGVKAIKWYREMYDLDATVGSFMFMIKNLIRQVEFTIVATGESAAHAREAEFGRTCLGDMSHSWQDFLSELLSFLPYGWAYFETVYKERLGDSADPRKRSQHNDGRIGWRKLAIRSQDSLDRWMFDDEGGIQGAKFFNKKHQSVFIPIEKSLLFRTESFKNSPEGRSILKNAWVAYKRKKRLEELEGVGAERDLVGIPDFQLPPRVLTSNAPGDVALRAKLEDIGQRMRNNEYAVMVRPGAKDHKGQDTGFDFGLIKSPGSKQFDLDKSIRRYKADMLGSVLAQFLLLGQTKTGSYSLASTQTDLFGYALGAILDTIVDVFNRFAIPALFKFNGVPRELWPEMIHGDIEKPDLQEVATYVATLVSAGAIDVDDPLQDKLREYGGLPERERTGGTLPRSQEDEFKTSEKRDRVGFAIDLVRSINKGEITKTVAVNIAKAMLDFDEEKARSIFEEIAA